MELKEVFAGAILIVLGICVQLLPNLTVRAEDLLKKYNINVNLERVPKLLSYSLIILGASLIIIRSLFGYLMLGGIADAVIPIFIPTFIVIVGVIATLPSLKQ